MRRSGLLPVLLLAACAAAPPQPPPVPPAAADGAALLQLEGEWREAWRRGDGAAVARIEDESFTRSDGGETFSRADDLGEIAAHSVEYSRYENREQTVEVTGGSAVVSGVCVMEGVAGDAPFKREWRFTDRFAWRDGAWRALSEQWTRPEPR
jgi:hypothetical protein